MTPEITPNSSQAVLDKCAAENYSYKPTPEEIDVFAQQYLEYKQQAKNAAELLAGHEAICVHLVQTWGIVVPRAEKSRILTGKLGSLQVTKSDTLTIMDDRVDLLKDALFANGYGEFFMKLFAQRVKWEVVEGAEAALKSESLPRRLSEKVLNLWGRCITVKPKKPSLKVILADPAKPAKKAKKAGA
jgi:hypothetical protein